MMDDDKPKWTLRVWLFGHPDGWHFAKSPSLLRSRISHRLFGLRRGCSCTRCFPNPRRRVTNDEVKRDRRRIYDLEQRMRAIDGRWPAPDSASDRSGTIDP